MLKALKLPMRDPKFLPYSPRLWIGRTGSLNCPCLILSRFPHLEEFLRLLVPSSLYKMVRAESNPKPLYSASHTVGAQEIWTKSEYLLTSADCKQRGGKGVDKAMAM